MTEDENENFTRKSVAVCPFIFAAAIFLTAAVIITAAALAAFGASDGSKKAAVKNIGTCLELELEAEKGQASFLQGESLLILRFLLGKEEKAENLSDAERINYLCENIIVRKKKGYKNGILQYEYIYDKSGNRIEWITYNDDGSMSFRWESEYDAKGNTIRSINYDGTGYMQRGTEYKYDKDNNKIEELYYRHDLEKPTAQVEWEYNEAGILRKYIEWQYHSSAIYPRYEEIYDEEGKEIQSVLYDDEGSVSSRKVHEYEYDEHESREWVFSYGRDGSISSWVEYEYDKAGNRTEHVAYGSDGSILLWEEYEYDESGNLIKAVWNNNRYGGVKTWIEYERDKEGRLLKMTEYYGSGIYQTECVYDEMGNLLQEISRSGDVGCSDDDLSVDREEYHHYNIFGDLVEIRMLNMSDIDNNKYYTYEYIYALP